MLQTRTVEPTTLELLKQLMLLPELGQFYLVGGTALALQMGHRVSVDIDLFTTSPFATKKITDLLLRGFEDVLIEVDTEAMLIANVNGVKVDFVKMGYPILFPPLEIEGVRMLEMKDIAPMKLKAIAQRGSKKDFYDLFFLLDYLPLKEMLDIFSSKFKQQELFHIVKSLTYFEDAEQYANPRIFDKSLTWVEVQRRISGAVQELL